MPTGYQNKRTRQTTLLMPLQELSPASAEFQYNELKNQSITFIITKAAPEDE
jgi:hypothetical protein